MHALKTSTFDPRTTIRTPSQQSLADAEQTADRLRSWASVMSTDVTGEPLIRFEGDEWSIHLPVPSDAKADPEAGVDRADLPGGKFILIEDVDFYAIDNALDALDSVVMDGVTSRDYGALEFHSNGSGGFAVGTLAVPVRGDAEGLPASLDVAAAPALGEPNVEPERRGAAEPQPEAPVVVPGGPAPLTAIAIASQVGSLGETIAYLAATELGWRYCRDSVVQEAAASDPKIEVDDVERATRHRSRLERVLEALAVTPMSPMDPGISMVPGQSYIPPIMDDDEARAAIEETMFSLADTGGVVIAGHGAAQVLRDHQSTLSVFVCAPEQIRTSRIANESMEWEDAERLVRDTDDERRAYFKDVYGADWRDALEYDVTINTSSMDPRSAAGMLAALVRASRAETQPTS